MKPMRVNQTTTKAKTKIFSQKRKTPNDSKGKSSQKAKKKRLETSSDSEDYEEKEIKTMLCPTEQNTNILRILAATKHEQIIEKYATMEIVYTPPSQFSGGFSTAMECIEMMALEAINKRFKTISPQDYKWANTVIGEETGDVMNLKKLMRHPKYTETWT